MTQKKVEAPAPCLGCGKRFEVYPFQLAKGWGRFCSISCGSKSRKGELNAYWCGGNATYAAVHYRLRSQRGEPSACVRCGRPGQEWAYTHDDPEELTSDKGRPYSTDLDKYVPMCRKCHRKEDGNRKRNPR